MVNKKIEDVFANAYIYHEYLYESMDVALNEMPNNLGLKVGKFFIHSAAMENSMKDLVFLINSKISNETKTLKIKYKDSKQTIRDVRKELERYTFLDDDINQKLKEFLAKSEKFNTQRNNFIHHLFSEKISDFDLEKLEVELNKAQDLLLQMRKLEWRIFEKLTTVG